MRFIIFLAVTVLAVAGALAQQPATPGEQALGGKLMQEIQAGLNCNTNLIALQAELAKAQARIKELEPKPEPAK